MAGGRSSHPNEAFGIVWLPVYRKYYYHVTGKEYDIYLLVLFPNTGFDESLYSLPGWHGRVLKAMLEVLLIFFGPICDPVRVIHKVIPGQLAMHMISALLTDAYFLVSPTEGVAK